MTNHPIPTVKIDDPRKPGDYVVINAHDFDPERHTLWGHDPKAEPSTPGEWQETPPRKNPVGAPAGDEITHEIARNGAWRVHRGGAEIMRGRGAEALAEYLREIGA